MFTGFTGVYVLPEKADKGEYSTGRFMAMMKLNGDNKILGFYDCPIVAAEAYNKESRRILKYLFDSLNPVTDYNKNEVLGFYGRDSDCEGM